MEPATYRRTLRGHAAIAIALVLSLKECARIEQVCLKLHQLPLGFGKSIEQLEDSRRHAFAQLGTFGHIRFSADEVTTVGSTATLAAYNPEVLCSWTIPSSSAVVIAPRFHLQGASSSAAISCATVFSLESSCSQLFRFQL
ncbi:hypothetical protein Aduo_013299 [Ancylostoma duodenale]